jgi:hypothetical protein
MIVKRILHPVGHGAFFTEQFFEKRSRENVFNVVYDCGIIYQSRIKLNEEIDNTFLSSNRPHVDFLFISHLDEDHVNGIQYMVRKGLVDDLTTFVLPFFNDKELAIYDEFYGRGTLAMFDGIGRTIMKKVIYVPMSDAVIPENDYGEIDMEGDYLAIEGTSNRVNGVSGEVIKAGMKFSWRKVWEYIPFNLNDNTSKAFWGEIQNTPELQGLDLDGVKKMFEDRSLSKPLDADQQKRKETAEKQYRALKDVYNRVGNKVTGDRLININSLAVVSQGVNNVGVRLSLIDEAKLLEAGCARPLYDSWPSDGFGACTYTGDLNLRQDQDFEMCEKKVRSVLRGKSTLQLLQIPHHGSQTSYNKSFSGDLSGACFVNYNSEKSNFNKDMLFDFFSARKYLMPVTEIDSSRVEQEFLIL